MNKKTINVGKLTRNLSISVRAIPEADGRQVYELSVSSEQPVERAGFFGERWIEVLDHSEAAIDFTRANGLPLLLDHDMTAQVGVVEALALDPAARKLNSTVRFSRSNKGQEVELDVADGIRQNVSIGYVVKEFTAEGEQDGVPVYRATKWMPIEVSIVSVPADHTVGVGRAIEGEYTATVVDKKDEEAEGDTTTAAADTPAEESAETKEDTQEAAVEASEGETGAQDNPTEEAAEAPTNAESDKETEDEKAGAARAEPLSQSQAAAPGDASNSEQRSIQVTDNANIAFEIARMSEANGMSSRTAEFLQRGLTVEQVAREILAQKRSSPLKTNEPIMELNEKDQKSYSYARAIQVALGDATGGLEAEIHTELSRSVPKGYEARGGVFVPMSVSGKRTMDSKTAGAGKESVFTEGGELIDLLYNQSVVLGMGARMYAGLQGNVSFPKITGGSTAHWVTENPGVDVEESQLSTGAVSLSPKTLQATTAFSRQLLSQSVIGIEAAVRADITTQHALAIDRAALHGDGVTAPRGIYNTAGVNVVDMADGVSYGKLVDMVAKVLASNALMGTQGFATTPLMAGKLAQTLVAQAAGAGFLWNGRLDDGTVAGYMAQASNQLRADMGTNGDEHGLVFGNFSDLLIGTWGALELVVDPYALKKQGLIEVTSYQLADVAIRHAESFTKATHLKL